MADSKYQTIGVYSADFELINTLQKNKMEAGPITKADVIHDLLKTITPEMFLLSLEGKEHVDAIKEALKVFKEKNKAEKVDDSLFLSELAKAFVQQNSPGGSEKKVITEEKKQ